MSEDQKKVYTIISHKLGIPENELNDSADLRNDLNAQDIEIADLLMEIEKSFEVHFTSDEASGIHTIGDIIDLVHGV